jgi:lipoyl(octanoyl) transferase
MNIDVKNTVKPIDYNKSIKILEKRVEDVLLGKKNELLWILEHKTAYTAGISSSSKDIINKKIKIIKTKRGGRITIHSPGQKVVYFVINLNNRKKDIRKLINNIENCIIKTLNHYGVESFADRKNIGIWTKSGNSEKKIAAIGIRVKSWIAYHGFSININVDLKKYKKIIPCGINDKKLTNLYSIKSQSYKGLGKRITKNFLNNLKI